VKDLMLERFFAELSIRLEEHPEEAYEPVREALEKLDAAAESKQESA